MSTKASNRSIQATASAVQRIAPTRALGMKSMAIPPKRGRNVIIDKIGNMPLPPHCIVKDNQCYANQNGQGVVTHITGLQTTQARACPSKKEGYASAPTIERFTFQQACRGTSKPENRLNDKGR